MKTISIALALLLFSSVAFAGGVQKYVDDDGVMHIGQRPPQSKGAAVTVIKKDSVISDAPASVSKCEVHGLSLKETDYGPSTIGVSFKVDVQNYGKPGSCFITIQGVDAGGYEILTNIIIEDFDLNAVRSVSDNRRFMLDQYAQVKEWRIKSVSKGRLLNK